jgi:hypothetical protein
MTRTVLITITILITLLASADALALRKGIKTKVYATLWDESLGGMANIKLPSDVWCAEQDNGRGWVYFSTDGADLSPVVAESNMRQAQLAMTRGTVMTVYVDDARRQGEICLAYRTILLP